MPKVCALPVGNTGSQRLYPEPLCFSETFPSLPPCLHPSIPLSIHLFFLSSIHPSSIPSAAWVTCGNYNIFICPQGVQTWDILRPGRGRKGSPKGRLQRRMRTPYPWASPQWSHASRRGPPCHGKFSARLSPSPEPGYRRGLSCPGSEAPGDSGDCVSCDSPHPVLCCPPPPSRLGFAMFAEPKSSLPPGLAGEAVIEDRPEGGGGEGQGASVSQAGSPEYSGASTVLSPLPAPLGWARA